MIRLVLTSTIIALLTSACQAQHTTDTLEQVKKALADKKAILVDVREKKETDDGTLKDAKLDPLSAIKTKSAEDLLKLYPKGTIVYMHCKAGGRCVQAAEILKKQGIDARPLAPAQTG